MTAAFIGCKISLISKSEIRYEGVLYTIDPHESTIALAKVRSYGTEDRVTDKPVAARSDVYEYIIFRASDIKDLIVDDPPTAPGLSDPAIIQAQSVGSSNIPPVSLSSVSTSNSASLSIPQKGTSVTSGLASLQTPATVTSGGQSAANSHSRGSTPVHTKPTQGDQQRQQTHRKPEWQNRSGQNRDGQNREGQSRDGQNQGGQTREGQQNRVYHQQQFNRGGRREYSQGFQQQTQQTRAPRQPPPPNQTQKPFAPNNFKGFRQNQNDFPQQNRPSNRGPQQQYYNSRNRGNFNSRPRTEVTKLDDYDFEKANEEFTEMEKKFVQLGVEQNGEQETAEPEVKEYEAPQDENSVCYNKTKSFFDSISCEAIERSKGNVQRIDRRQERKLNEETFGVGGIRTYRGRGGYSNRGYGNRGGYGQRSYNRGYVRRGSNDNRRYGTTNSENRTQAPTETTA